MEQWAKENGRPGFETPDVDGSIPGQVVSGGEHDLGGTWTPIPDSVGPELIFNEDGINGNVVPPKINKIDGFYQAEGTPLKFSEYYYERLWSTGRGAPFLQAKEVLETATKIESQRKPGFVCTQMVQWKWYITQKPRKFGISSL